MLDLDLDRKEETFLGGRAPGPGEAFRWHVFNGRSERAVSAALGCLLHGGAFRNVS